MRNKVALSANGEFAIAEFFLFESGRYNDRFLRSLKFGSITDDVVDNLSQEILRTDGRGFSSGTIARSRTGVIGLDDRVDRDRDRIDLTNGYNTKRFCFIMKIVEEAPSAHHVAKTYLISGYTDRMEYSRFSKSLPDDTEFHVNAMLETTNERANNNNQLFGYGNYSATADTMYMIRPQDVISKYSFTNLNKKDGMKSSFRSDQLNGRLISTNSRQNTIASTYLSRTLTGLHKNRMEIMGEDAVRSNDDDDNDNPASQFLGTQNARGRNRSVGRATELEEELERVRAVVSEDPSEDFDFLRQIKRASRDSTSSAGIFTFRQLTRICPTVADITTVTVMRENKTTRSGLADNDHSRIGDMDGHEWGGATVEEIVATNVSNAIIAACSVSFIMVVDIIFALRQDEFTGQFEWDFEIGYNDDGRTEEGSVVFADNISEEKERELIDRLGFIMIDDVLNGYLRQGYEMMVSVRYNMNREIFISVAIDTDEPYELCTPIFCDSLASPTQSNRESSGMRIGEGAVQLYQEIFRAIKA